LGRTRAQREHGCLSEEHLPREKLSDLPKEAPMNEIYVKIFIFILVLILLIVEVFRYSITYWEIVIKIVVLIFVLVIIVWERRKLPRG
jgi:hypothetical protein